MKFRTFLSMTLALGLSTLTTDRAFAGDLSASPYRVLPSVPVVGGNFGTSVAVGDLDGNGYVDVAVGAPQYPGSGRVFVFLNSAAGLATSTSGNWVAVGNDADSLFGAAIAVADLDGDGYGDLIVGAPSYHNAGTSVGAVFVYRGSAGGLVLPTPDWVRVGAVTGGEFGSAVATGDLDGDSDSDSHLDVVVGAPGSGNGAVHAYGTSVSGLTVVPSTVLGDQVGGRFGYAIAVRDLDLDGKADVIVGAPNDQAEAGRVFICPGSVTGIGPATWTVDGIDALGRLGTAVTAGDVTGDGRPDVIVGAPVAVPGRVSVYAGSAVGLPAATPSWIVTGEEPGSRFGIAVASDDVNGDSRPDLVVGASLNGLLLGNVTGRIYVYLGTPSGLATTAAATRDGLLGNESFGRALAIAPINADGFKDVVVGAPGGDHAYVYTGSCSTITVYPDADGDGYGDAAGVPTDVCVGSPTPGYALNNGDCDDTDATRSPGSVEVCGPFNVDEDCDGLADDSDLQGALGKTLIFPDMDGDGYGSGALGLFCHGSTVNSDCNDSDASTYPLAAEIVGDNIDQNCDGHEICYADADGDGYPGMTTVISLDADCNDLGEGTTAQLALGADCDDAHAVAHPGGTEVCDVDGIDEDCDGLVDNADPDAVKLTFYQDADYDGFGNPFMPLQLCDPVPGTTSDNTDCDDTRADIHPGATEIPGNAFDEDCDQVFRCYVDLDGDGYRPDLTSTVDSYDGDCTDDGEASESDPAGDCDDTIATIHPNAVEVCGDAADDNCDGLADCLDPACAGDATCPSGPSPCAGGPFTCKNPGVTKLDLRNVTPDDGDKLVFRWTLGDETSAAELGDPTVDTNYAVCVWDEVAGSPVLVMEMQAPPAGNCLGRPCWRAAGDGFRYRDPGHVPSGVDRMKVQAGPLGKSSIKVTGRGAELPDPPMPFQQDPHIIVQVVNSLGNCWGAHYMSPAQSNTDTRLEVKEKP